MDLQHPAQHHHSSFRGVKTCQCRQGDPPQPHPPTSPSGVIGWSSWHAGTQQLNLPPPPLSAPPSHTVPTWASVARGENPTLQEAPAATAAPSAATAAPSAATTAPSAATAAPSDAMALCRCCVVMGFRAHFSIKNNAGCEEICLFCRFLDPAAASSSLTRPPPSRRHQRWRNCVKITTCTSSTQKRRCLHTCCRHVHIALHCLRLPPTTRLRQCHHQ
jgi:hypothetical protein